MYSIFTYISPECMVNVGKYSIHGWYGKFMIKDYQGFTGDEVRRCQGAIELILQCPHP